MANRGDILKIRAAKQICATCVVINECRDYSLHLAQNFDTYGVYGGWSRNERINHLRTAGVSVRRWGGVEASTNRGSSLREYGHGTSVQVRRHQFNDEPLCDLCQEGFDRRNMMKALARRRAAVKKRRLGGMNEILGDVTENDHDG